MIKNFNLHGFALNPEHLHLLIEPTGRYSYSEIIGAIKRNFTRDCNDLLSGKSFRRDGEIEAENSCAIDHLHRKYIDIRGNEYFQNHLCKLSALQARYFMKHQNNNSLPFKWQSSFRDHLIRDERDYPNHLEYIKKQPLKHQLPERKWYWIMGEIDDEAKD